MGPLTRRPADPLRIFKDPRVATFLERPNRFLVRCRLGGRTVEAFLPNPGRLHELLLPGRNVHLVTEEAFRNGSTPIFISWSPTALSTARACFGSLPDSP